LVLTGASGECKPELQVRDEEFLGIRRADAHFY